MKNNTLPLNSSNYLTNVDQETDGQEVDEQALFEQHLIDEQEQKAIKEKISREAQIEARRIFEEDRAEAVLEHANRFNIGGKRIEGRRQLGTILERKLQTAVGKRGFMTVHIIAQWKHIVGPDLYPVTKPQKIRFFRKDQSQGTLVIKTLSSAHALTISFQEDRIIERVNSFFGYKAVNDIHIIHGSLNMDEFSSADKNAEQLVKETNRQKYLEEIKKSKTLDKIQDPNTKKALMEIYASIKSKK